MTGRIVQVSPSTNARELWVAVTSNGLRIAFATEREAVLNKSPHSSVLHVREVTLEANA